MAETRLEAFKLYCQTCGQPVTLVYRVVHSVTPQRWQCPYEDCRTFDYRNLSGEVIRVRRGHADLPNPE